MSELTSMKRDMKPEYQRRQESILAHEKSDYPEEMCIKLGAEEIEKLGFNGMPRLGDRLYLKAFVEVAGLEEEESYEGGKEREIKLQITHMKLQMAKENETEQVFYGDAPKPRMV